MNNSYHIKSLLLLFLMSICSRVGGQQNIVDGALVPTADAPAFGVIVDYNKYPQVTNLPTMYITTDEIPLYGDDMSNKTESYYRAKIVIVDRNGAMKQISDSVGIRGRGNSTWNWAPKKPWRLKFDNKIRLLAELDSNFEEQKTFAKAKSWNLLANWFDYSMIRNALTYEISRACLTNLPFKPAAKFVDLVFNGQYYGTMQVTDQVSIGSKRIDIDEVTGWFLEITYRGKDDAFLKENYVNYGNGLIIANVNNPVDSIQQKNINFMVRSFLGGLMHETLAKNVSDDGMRKYLNLPTLIDWTIGEEISSNYDGTSGNVYAYKEADEETLSFGPLWDFDIAYGNYGQMSDIHFWENKDHGLGMTMVLKALYEDKVFVKGLYERYHKMFTDTYDGYSLTDYLTFKIDSLQSLLLQSQQKNYTQGGWWDGTYKFNKPSATNRPLIEKNVTYWKDGVRNMGKTYKTDSNSYLQAYMESIRDLRKWIEARLVWLDKSYHEQYVALGCDDETATSIHSLASSVKITPIQGGINISSTTYTSVCIHTLSGILVDQFTLSPDECRTVILTKGIYIVNNSKVVVK